jgi:beta-lactamase class A
MSTIKNKIFSFSQVLGISILTILVTLLVNYSVDKVFNKKNKDELTSESNANSCLYNIKRLNGFQFIRPLLFVDEDCQSNSLSSVQQSMNGVIEKYKASGGLTNASVYLREYGYNEWTSINETETYEPGSLFKVPVMIAILKMCERNPSLLNKKLAYTTPVHINKNIEYPAVKSIELGKSYTIKELLAYMIRYSDNSATVLLETQLDTKTVYKLFADFGLEVPNKYAKSYLFNVKDYSLFIRSIYNATYLTPEYSEIAAELLDDSEFKIGIRKNIPNNIKIISKFGEAGNPSERQLHETALIYINKKPYLLTIMTKGNDMRKLSEFIAEISSTVYDDMIKQAAEMI